MKTTNIILGLIALSYFIHLESVIIPVYQDEPKYYCGEWKIVQIDEMCIVWSLISMAALILLLYNIIK